jgi:3-dehydroquinate dehydratase-2
VPAPVNAGGIAEADLALLDDLFGDDDEATDQDSRETHQLLVLNGPNVNLLGISAGPAQAGTDFAALLELCRQTAQEAGFDRCVCLQSNHEGDLIDQIQDAYCVFDAILINPASYATSRSIAEALRIVGVPYQFVHLDLESASQTGFSKYRQAIFDLANAAGLNDS